jgi:hypothetical protein
VGRLLFHQTEADGMRLRSALHPTGGNDAYGLFYSSSSIR